MNSVDGNKPVYTVKDQKSKLEAKVEGYSYAVSPEAISRSAVKKEQTVSARVESVCRVANGNISEVCVCM